MDESFETDIITRWRLSRPLKIEPVLIGTNNRSFRVTDVEGAYVLKWYRNVWDLRQLRFEHALLNALASATLPFAVPAPVPTLSGENHVTLQRGSESYLLVLFRLISGRSTVLGDAAEAHRCGEALAALDEALGRVSLDTSVALPEAFGSLSSIHILVPRPLEAVEELAGSDRIARIMSDAEDRWQRVTSIGNRQLIHGDFYPSNTLMCSGKVSGILDFEFSGLGLRVMDFAVGLAAFSTKGWKHGCLGDTLEAFARGYLRKTPFAGEELSAVPTMMLKREASSLVHWIGRMEQGLTSTDDIQSRLLRFLALERWLERNESRLLDCLDRING